MQSEFCFVQDMSVQFTEYISLYGCQPV